MPESTSFTDSVTLIGAGQMGRALAIGFCHGGKATPAGIVIVDPSAASRSAAEAALPGSRAAASITAGVAASRFIILAVKPQHAAVACEEISHSLTDTSVVISIVAGLSISSLTAATGTDRVIRVMPNTPCLIGKGVSVMSAAPAVCKDDRDHVRNLFAAVGTVHDAAENLLDAVTAVSGSGPGYVALLIEALTEGGVRAGLPRSLAQALAVETFAGTAALVAETGEHPAVIKDRVSSPGGTTIAGLAILERAGVRGAIADAVATATARAAELGRPTQPADD